ncbi:hypothetical protein Lal_00001145 [Lupinus albus]|nr:hypothetical protein Lal_00001145 [Lupinus albus]
MEHATKTTLRNFSEKFTTANEFDYEEDLRLCGENFVETHDVRVVELAHDRDLALHVSGEACSGEFLLVDYLHRHALTRFHVPRVVHLRERAASEETAKFVFPEQRGFLLRRRCSGGVFDLRHD